MFQFNLNVSFMHAPRIFARHYIFRNFRNEYFQQTFLQFHYKYFLTLKYIISSYLYYNSFRLERIQILIHYVFYNKGIAVYLKF